jgi:hypothetical protein
MRNAPSLALTLSLAALLGACGSPEVETATPDELDQALSSSYGGEIATDEAPAFGDPLLAAGELRLEDAAVADATTERPDLDGARRVRIALIWGYPRPHPDATEVVDWSGTITVANAALRVVSTLRFEERSDVILRPRTDIHTVAFESQTKPHADGLLLEVVMAERLNPEHRPVTLTFSSAVVESTLTIEAGMALSGVQTVDDAGHVLAYHVIRPDADGCAQGTLRGRWQAAGEVDGRVLGRLAGRFFTAEGRVRGHLRGVYGVRENGNQVWFAKVINAEGQFLGIIAGRWGEGKFAGLVLGRDEIVKGVVRGQYFEADVGGAGGFMGRWSERCGEDPREDRPSEGDEPEISLDAAIAVEI